MTAVMILYPGATAWPIWLAAVLCFLFAACVVLQQDTRTRRRLTVGVMCSLGLVAGPFVATGHAASVGSGICWWFPWLLECWFV